MLFLLVIEAGFVQVFAGPIAKVGFELEKSEVALFDLEVFLLLLFLPLESFA